MAEILCEKFRISFELVSPFCHSDPERYLGMSTRKMLIVG